MAISGDFGSLILLAWRGELTLDALLNAAASLESQGTAPLAAVLYQTWVNRTESPYLHVGYFNLGVTLVNLGDFKAAEAAYRKAADLAPAFMHPRLNLGLLFERQGKMEDAIEEWKWVEKNGVRDGLNKAIVVSAFNHLGRVLEAKKQFNDALQYLTSSLHLDPVQPDVLHHWVFLRQKECAWPVYAPIDGLSQDAMQDATSALAMLSVTDDPAKQLVAAQRYFKKKVLQDAPRLAPSSGYLHSKIRVGYLSSDFSLHPVSMLMVQLFELHDRSSFEVYGFCWSPQDGSALRERVIKSFDHFIRIDGLSDDASAQLIRNHEIDVLVDLQGQTAGARADILARCPAPIQITYLGLPATTGFPFIDYVIADEFLIPREQAPYYSEQPLYMPNIYQVSDRLRPVGARSTRQSCGLPESGFVFCSFNNSYKYTPEIFSAWMHILQRVPGSVLWLLADNAWAANNLVREAEVRGIARERLVFAQRVSPENYLAQYLCADLFLDTFPFNAGTTANDCLWMGCPLLTLSGRSFASRMAGALLTAAGLPELITDNLADYEDTAIALAHDAPRMQRLRDTLQSVHENGALFDTPLFVSDLEVRLKTLVHQLAMASHKSIAP